MGSAHGAGLLLHQIQIPVLVIIGSNSELFDMISDTEAIKKIPNVTTTVVEGTHFLPMENPTGVAQAIMEFVGKNLKSKM